MPKPFNPNPKLASWVRHASSPHFDGGYPLGDRPGDPPQQPAGLPAQYLTDDGARGVSRTHWSRYLLLPWVNNMGDWTDANGTSQGSTPFGTLSWSGTGWATVDVTALVQGDTENRGMFLRPTTVAGRGQLHTQLNADAATRPKLVVDGGDHAPRAFAWWADSTDSPTPNDGTHKTTTGRHMIIQFDPLDDPAGITSAVLHIYLTQEFAGTHTVNVFRADPPAWTLGGANPQYGDTENIIEQVDFTDRASGAQLEVLDGGNGVRGSFIPSSHGSLNSYVQLSPADTSDPQYPIDTTVKRDDVYCRMDVLLEDGWTGYTDANKAAIGWDLRYGYWNTAQGGYWQNISGNGGDPGYGNKTLGNPQAGQWNYDGHSIRMEFGRGAEGHPYENLRPIVSYVYSLDQGGLFGDMVRIGNGVIQVGEWFTIEQRIKQNSIVGPYDADGNGTAVADGVLETWLNGELISSITNFRWRNHPDFGVQAMWMNWYYGGDNLPDKTLYYQMRDVIVSDSYIGPKRFPAWRDGLSAGWSANLLQNEYIDIVERRKTDGDFGSYYATATQGSVWVTSESPWAYSSGCYDPTRKQYIFTGGGHDDWLGSEVGTLDLSADALSWVRTDESAKLENGGEDATVPFQSTDSAGWKAHRNPSGRFAPISTHTYGGVAYLPELDKVFVQGSATYRSGMGNPGGATWIDPATGQWDETGAIADVPGGANLAALPISDLEVVDNADLDSVLSTWTQAVLLARNSYFRVLNAETGAELNSFGIGSVVQRSTAMGCLIPDPDFAGKLAFVADRNTTQFVKGNRANVCKQNGTTHSNLTAVNYGNTKPAAIGDGSNSRWIYMGDHIPGSTKIVVYKQGSGVYTLDTDGWVWSTLLYAEPAAVSNSGIWRRFEYMPELECFGLFAGVKGEGFYALPLAGDLQ